MGLFGKRKSRATRRAEARAIKARAKLEAKLSAKNEARRIKAAQRAESKALKAQLKARRDSDRAALKVAEAELKVAREGKLLSPTRIRRLLTVSRLLAPILTPPRCIPAATAWSPRVDAASAMQGVDDQRNILAELLIHRRRCPRPAPDRRSPARVRRATLRGHQTPLWWRASRATTRPELRPSAAGPTLWSNQANVQRSRTLSGHHANGREKPQ